ncbi:MAG: rRNA maturation RNase YbeY [Elusimicrobiota bacterium]
MRKIKIFDEQRKIKLDVKKISKYILRLEREFHLSKNSGYNIIFLNDTEIKKLNKRFRKTDRSTDVLSFPPEAPACRSGRGHLLADIFISVNTAKSNAKFYKQDFYTEILRLIIHGILHSIGYTDYSEKTKKNMWEKQEQVLKCIM